MGWLFVASVHSSYLIRKSFVTVFCYSNNRMSFLHCVSIIPIWTDYLSYSIAPINQYFYSMILFHCLFKPEIRHFRIISTISTFILGVSLHYHAAPRSAALWRASALDLKRRSCSWPLMLLYDHVLLVGQCVHKYEAISLDYPGQARLSNWLTKFSKPLSKRGESTAPPRTVRRTADYAASSPPLGCSLFIF